MVGTEGNQSKVPGALDGGGHRALVLGADAGLAARFYLPPVGHVPAKAVGILVINVFDMVDAEAAYLSAAVIARPPSAESARPAARPSTARSVASASGPASAWTVAATLLSARSAAAWAIAATLLPAGSGAVSAAGPRPLRRTCSCLLCRHVNSPSATWYRVWSVFAGPEARGRKVCQLPG